VGEDHSRIRKTPAYLRVFGVLASTFSKPIAPARLTKTDMLKVPLPTSGFGILGGMTICGSMITPNFVDHLAIVFPRGQGLFVPAMVAEEEAFGISGPARS
jgi:hypothetical protein